MSGALVWAYCPEPGCTSPAEVYDTSWLESTDGAVQHARVRCLGPERHHFLMPLAQIEPMEVLDR